MLPPLLGSMIIEGLHATRQHLGTTILYSLHLNIFNHHEIPLAGMVYCHDETLLQTKLHHLFYFICFVKQMIWGNIWILVLLSWNACMQKNELMAITHM